MREQLIHRWRLLVWALVAIPLSALSLAAFVFTVTDVALISVWVGIPMLGKDIAVTRWLADLHRRYAGGLRGVTVERPYLRADADSLLTRTRAVLADPATRRDVRWLFVNGTLGLFLAIVGVVEGILGMLFWWIPPGAALNLHAKVDVALLRPAEKSRLALRVQQLTESRAETVDTQAAELRRIERDLHDGAQARLVAIGMSLGLAEEQLARDPDGAESLLVEARDASSDALAELRDLVRGIHPPVLADRGPGRRRAGAGLGPPIPVDVRSRCPAPAARAGRVRGVLRRRRGARQRGQAQRRRHTSRSTLIADAGRPRTAGRGRRRRGSRRRRAAPGCAASQRRLSAFDGGLHVESPPGGPTKLAMVLPCASSSPKTSPSSGTA